MHTLKVAFKQYNVDIQGKQKTNKQTNRIKTKNETKPK